MAETTVEKFLARTVRLYEQERGDPFGPPLCLDCMCNPPIAQKAAVEAAANRFALEA